MDGDEPSTLVSCRIPVPSQLTTKSWSLSKEFCPVKLPMLTKAILEPSPEITGNRLQSPDVDVSCLRLLPFASMAKISKLRSGLPPVRFAFEEKTILCPSSLMEIPCQGNKVV